MYKNTINIRYGNFFKNNKDITDSEIKEKISDKVLTELGGMSKDDLIETFSVSRDDQSLVNSNKYGFNFLNMKLDKRHRNCILTVELVVHRPTV